MKKHILLYGLCGGVLIVVLKLIEYRFLVIEHSVEIYGGLIALFFSVAGIWLGLKLTKNKETIVIREVPVPGSGPFVLNETRRREVGITARELEILELIAQGRSNKRIAFELGISEKTVKCHLTATFRKVGLRDRLRLALLVRHDHVVDPPARSVALGDSA